MSTDVEMELDEMGGEETAAQEEAEKQRALALQRFADVLRDKRKAAVAARQGSGLEQRWREDEEMYDGIDDANRAEVTTKGQTPGAPITTEKVKTSGKSTVFVNITQPYVDMAASRLCDILLPTTDRPFKINPTPEPDIEQATNSTEVLSLTGPDGAPVQENVADIAKRMMAEAEAAAEKAEDKIWDWWSECRAPAELRKVVWEAAKIGTGVIKGPFPVKQTGKKITAVNGQVSIEIMNKLVPASKCVSPWNIFPDPGCGDSIHNGSHLFESDEMSYRQIEELKGTMLSTGQPMYLDDQIEQVLAEGPGGSYESKKADQTSDDRFKVWYYYGIVRAEDFQAAGFEAEDEESLCVIVMTINDRVVLAAQSYLEESPIPFDVFRWNKVAGSWAGQGVSRQVNAAQRIVNGSVRNMMDNAGVSSGPQIVLNRDIVSPANGVWEITGLKLWFLNDSDMKAGDAMASIVIPSLQQELMNIIEFGHRMAEKATSMPLLMQGEQGAATETVGGMTILDANASTVLQNRVKFFDEDVTEPHVRRYYEYLMLNHDDPACKGDFQIVAQGSTVFYQRDVMNQQLANMGPIVENPRYRINPEKWLKHWLKGQHIQPEMIQYTETEWAEVQKQMAQNQPSDPRIEVAKIKEQGATERAKLDTDRDTAYREALAEQTRVMAAAKERELELKHSIALLHENGAMAREIEKLKASLAETTMELNTQRELAKGGPAPQVAPTKMEPVGRAPDGEAFQK